MNGHDDNSKTLQFEAVKDEPEIVKPQQNRNVNDEFSVARKGRGYEINEKKESGNGVLIALICVLTVLLIGAIVLAVFVIKGDKKAPQPETEEAVVEKTEVEEEVPEVQNTTISCDLVFYPKTMTEKDDGSYRVKVDFLDSDGAISKTERIFINEDTDIRQDGERLALEGFLYYMETAENGDEIVFKGEISEEDLIAITLSFQTPVEEEIVSEEQTEEDEMKAFEEEAEKIFNEVDGI